MTLRRATGVWIEQGVRWTPDAEDRPGLETVMMYPPEAWNPEGLWDSGDLMTVLPDEAITVTWEDADVVKAIRVSASAYAVWQDQQINVPVLVSGGPHSVRVLTIRAGMAEHMAIAEQALWWWQGQFYWGSHDLAANVVAVKATTARANAAAASAALADASRKEQEVMREWQRTRRRALARAKKVVSIRESLTDAEGYKVELRRTTLNDWLERGLPWRQKSYYLTVRLPEQIVEAKISRVDYERIRAFTAGRIEAPFSIRSLDMHVYANFWFSDGKVYVTTQALGVDDVKAALGEENLLILESLDDMPSPGTRSTSEQDADAAETPSGQLVWLADAEWSVNMDGVGVHWSCAGKRGGRRRRCEEPDATVKATVYGELERLRSDQPMLLARDRHGGRTLWWYRDGYWWDDEGLTAEEVGLLLFDRERKREARFDRLRKISAREEDLAGARRERIPDDVRAFVWERDEGRCVRCGAEDDLQFDHVIPVAKGGGVAVDNIQILCGDCNRAKSDSIA